MKCTSKWFFFTFDNFSMKSCFSSTSDNNFPYSSNCWNEFAALIDSYLTMHRSWRSKRRKHSHTSFISGRAPSPIANDKERIWSAISLKPYYSVLTIILPDTFTSRYGIKRSALFCPWYHTPNALNSALQYQYFCEVVPYISLRGIDGSALNSRQNNIPNFNVTIIFNIFLQVNEVLDVRSKASPRSKKIYRAQKVLAPLSQKLSSIESNGLDLRQLKSNDCKNHDRPDNKSYRAYLSGNQTIQGRLRVQRPTHRLHHEIITNRKSSTFQHRRCVVFPTFSMSFVRIAFCALVIRIFWILVPSKYFFNVATPELIHSSILTTPSKTSRRFYTYLFSFSKLTIWRTWALDNCFIFSSLKLFFRWFSY